METQALPRRASSFTVGRMETRGAGQGGANEGWAGPAVPERELRHPLLSLPPHPKGHETLFSKPQEEQMI